MPLSDRFSSVSNLYGPALTVLLCFGIFYPTHFLISDELRYFAQALAWSEGSTHIRQCYPCGGFCDEIFPGDYPPGTALLAIPFIALGGPKAVFLVSIFSLIGGIGALALLFAKTGKPVFWALYPLVFLPAVVLTRTFMSDLPGFAIAAFFLLVWSLYQTSRTGIFWAGFLGGLGLLFRETNLLFVLPFLIGVLWRKTAFRGWLWGGFLIGLIPRLVAAQVCFNDPFYLKDPGYPFFQWEGMLKQLVVYGLVLLVVLPGGLWFWWKSKWNYRVETGVAVFLFLAVYSTYGYNAFAGSGAKGLILQGRFMLPLVPFLTISAASAPMSATRLLQKGIPVLSGVIFIGIQLAGGWYNREQQQLTAMLRQIPGSVQVSFTPEETAKFLNDLDEPVRVLDGNALLPHALECDSVWYAHIIDRSDSPSRIEKSSILEQKLRLYFKDWDLKEIGSKQIIGGTRLRIWKIHRRDQHG